MIEVVDYISKLRSMLDSNGFSLADLSVIDKGNGWKEVKFFIKEQK